MAYEFHYTYVLEQNVFMQKYVLNTSSVPDTLLGSEETRVNNKDFLSESLHSTEGENNKQTFNRHLISYIWL